MFCSKWTIFSAMWCLWLTGPVAAEVRLCGVFGDHMVLQRDIAVPVWGWARPGETVTVQVGTQEKSAETDAEGQWRLSLDALSVGAPLTMSVTGSESSNTVTLEDILVGEVWLCSGQSNMAMTVSRAKEFEQEQAKANWPQIRHFKTAAHATPELQSDVSGEWAMCNSDTVGGFSATAYFFARKLHQELSVPIGLMNSSWGGTDVAAWTSVPAQQQIPSIVPKLEAYQQTIASYNAEDAARDYEAALARWKTRAAAARKAGEDVPRRPRAPVDPETNQNRPGNLFNGMIHPLIPYAMRGAIWYQGERNARTIEDGALYGTQLKTLIRDWRKRWDQGPFPFITVQLPNYRAPQEEPVERSGWVLVREGQQKTLSLENTGLAVTTDVGEADDIHPRDKQTVGLRLALWALGTTYGKEITYSGPLKVFYQYRTGTPGRMAVNFLHSDGLQSSDGKPLRGFAVAGPDRVFHRATARVDKQTGMVVLSSAEVATPVAARYNWAEHPEGNLINGAGLPAAPFRTDSWE